MSKNTLSSPLWRKINHFLLQTSKIISKDRYLIKVLSEIGKLIPFTAAHIITYQDENCNFSKLTTLNIEENTTNSYLEYFQHIDTIKKKDFNSPGAVKSTNLINYKKWKKTEYFNDFLLYNNFYYLAGVDIYFSGKLKATITLIRGENSPDFNKSELLIMNILESHIGGHLNILDNIKANEQKKLFSIKSWLENNIKNYNLTPREKEVVFLILKGYKNFEIAQELFISENTVKKHLSNIFSRCDVHSKTELIGLLLGIK